MKISILTLFPEMFSGPFDHSIVKKAKEKKLVDVNFVNIRDFGVGPHKIVDDKSYGGGHGMILRVDVLEKAITQTKNKNLGILEQKVVLLSPHGKTFNQRKALEFASLKHLILVCGHYEGIDERIKKFIDEELSIGDFIVTGGEIPAMLVTDAVARLVKGVLKEGVTSTESFSEILEYPQYTKPNNYKTLAVPSILLSGNHEKIKSWRDKISHRTTEKLRPDLLRSNRSLLGR
ncbi:MAG: tRNA (guanosine(37)-N1)-methyltransferase TrmD [Candidatus Levybacteria bacterium RIFCSPLOWO2_01_FULL_39_24]|nr:MAG: tRNA (guanosine(37)-N1)-methyltransferase TrmD [Candidatus Levybacteria bacterium RIFCSPHIGHO2_01_FULL_40_16]OGH28830.1 MAG: tRNA (guanosine(37)-N1)-methyltransferase TrmD [Candidatus Levybacteria bacterium RIFCSPHIGHO2_12_FULL_39_9]OGH46530.1 MAG: tRNA (guanosine(37)-N1)-methyltransferase TrmD [Candidatus Levybacteria bacterium RIFCSPLOWO2_01_FULL_39_24]